MNVKIIKVKEYNTWTVWNIVNKKEYHEKLKKFLTKDLKLITRNNISDKKSNNLIEFGINTKIKMSFLNDVKPGYKRLHIFEYDKERSKT